jgi:hypothetical protein
MAYYHAMFYLLNIQDRKHDERLGIYNNQQGYAKFSKSWV